IRLSSTVLTWPSESNAEPENASCETIASAIVSWSQVTKAILEVFMRIASLVTVICCGLLVLHAAAGENKPLTPVEAIKKVNEEVTVQMLVKAAKNRLEKRGEIYLDSEESFRDEKNLGIVITKTGAATFKQAGVYDP